MVVVVRGGGARAPSPCRALARHFPLIRVRLLLRLVLSLLPRWVSNLFPMLLLILSKFNHWKADLIRLGQVWLLLFLLSSLFIHFSLGLGLANLFINGQSEPLIKMNKQTNQQKQQKSNLT